MDEWAKFVLGGLASLAVAVLGWLGVRVHRGVTADMEDAMGEDFVRRDRLVKELISENVFARISQLDGLGQRIEHMTSVSLGANDLAAQNHAAIERLKEADRVGGEALTITLTRIERQLRDMDGRQREQQDQIKETATILRTITERLDRPARNGGD